MKYMPLAILFIFTIFFIGCGGGGGNAEVRDSTISGVVMDDYLEKATVCVDRNSDYQCSINEPITTTGTKGAYTLKVASSDINAYPLVATANEQSVQVDEKGNKTPFPSTLTLITPKEAQGNISPITTLVYADMLFGNSFDVAQKKVMAIFDFTNSSYLYYDYMADSTSFGATLRELARKIGEDLHGVGPAEYEYHIKKSHEKASSGTYHGDKHRIITVKNHCPYEVKLSSKGSSASQIACTNTDCPSGYFCYKKSSTARYCVPGSVTAGTSLPVTSLTGAGVTINKSACKAGADAYSPGNQYVDEGQCRCRKDSDCDTSQICKLVDTDNYWGVCYWQLGDENGEFIPSNSSTAIKIDESATNPKPNQSTIQSGGRFDINIGCDAAGNCASNADNSNPATSIEFTFASGGADYYDVSYINGFNSPATFYPDFNTTVSNLNLSFDGNYSCGAAGADATTLLEVAKMQKDKNGTSPMTNFSGLGCTNDFNSKFDDSSNLIGMNFIYSDKNSTAQTTCTKHSQCDSVNGVPQYCGLTFDQVNDNNSTTVCGYRVGYWTYAQFCAVNSDFSSSTIKTSSGMDINCSKPAYGNSVGTNASYALCKNIDGTTDAATSCWNNPTNGYCCGWADWSKDVNGTTKDWKTSDKATGSGDNWIHTIKPFVGIVKDACPLAYSYQYDDPYSTFQCKSSDEKNNYGYVVELCKEGRSGLYPPSMSCDGNFSAVNIQIPEGYEASVFKDSSKYGSFSTSVDLNISDDFNVTTTSEYYKITLQNLYPDKNDSCSCVYKISQNSCIVNELDSSSSGICCDSWGVVDGDSIQTSQFYGPGDTSRCPSNKVVSTWSDKFLATAPADYNISISYQSGGSVLDNNGTTVEVNQSTYNTSTKFKIKVHSNSTSKNKTCDIVAPTSTPAQSIYIDSSGSCDAGFAITCSGAQRGRNITIGAGW
jgi:hypothetical protein